MAPSMALGGGSATSGSLQGSPRASSKPPTPTSASVSSLPSNRNSSRSPAGGGARGVGAVAAAAAPLTRADLVREHSRRELKQRQQRLESPVEEEGDKGEEKQRHKNGERQQVSFGFCFVFFYGIFWLVLVLWRLGWC